MHHQTTLAKSITYTGIGLHSGKNVTIVLRPAAAGTGIVFSRVDLPGAPRVAACAGNVTNTMRATTLEAGVAKVFTVEHLLAAMAALQLDNCLIEIDSVEPPVTDGSALPFIRLIEAAGMEELPELRPDDLFLKETVAIRYPDRFIAVLPYDGWRISFTSVNPHPLLGVQFADFEIDAATFVREIAPARTIGFMHEVEALKAQGLALGGNLENAVVYDETQVLTPLRFSDELVRHKILDVIGDLALAGRVRGHIVAFQSGHSLNTALARAVLDHTRQQGNAG
ncbi:MAG TPA: UDP-3-O-acyl-N-acetylglucosamine deacetylase [Patescibacteria group bacterium]|nr:UDP-3-O-acyl-N-acetylglucosamine deacetylase [Patescibacteria group bacterium]